MEKIKKEHNHIVVFIVFLVLSLFTGTSQGYDLKAGLCLRKPLSTNIGEDIPRLADGREAYIAGEAHLGLVLQNIPQITHEVNQRLGPIQSMLEYMLIRYNLPDDVRREIESLVQQWSELSQLISQALKETNSEEQSMLMREVLLKVPIVTKSLEESLNSINKQPEILQLRFVQEATYLRLIDGIEGIARSIKISDPLFNPVIMMDVSRRVEKTLSSYGISEDLIRRVDVEIKEAVGKIWRIRFEFMEAVGIPDTTRAISTQEKVNLLMASKTNRACREAIDKINLQRDRICVLLDSLKNEPQVINANSIVLTPREERILKEDVVSVLGMVSDVKFIFLIGERKLSQLDINLVLNRTVFFFVSIGDIGTRIIEDYGPNLALINADPTELRQIFLNLLVNARDAISGKADGQITVSTGLDDSGRYIVVKVTDNGSGISPDVRQRIFESYFTTKGKRGTGLGLPIVKQIVERYNGTISVKSTVGEGAEFKVMLPVAVLGEARPQHEYVEVELGKDEANAVFQQIREGVIAGAGEYMMRFKNGVKRREPSFELAFSEQLSIHLNPGIVFHEGLLKDEQGVCWIVKKHKVVPESQRDEREGRPDKNDPKRERFAYLLAKGRANLTEIRDLSLEEAQAISYLRQLSPEELKEYYLIRVVTKENMQSVNLPQQELNTAFSAILVANVLMRKWDQHLLNIGYSGRALLSLDHDETFRNDIFSHDEASLGKYLGLYGLHVVIESVLGMIDSTNASNTLFIDDLKDIQSYGIVRSQHIIKNMIDDFGLGGGLVSAESWDEKQLRESIVTFKRIPINEIRKFAGEAGYSKEDAEVVVNFVTQNQKTLGTDIDKLLKFLTNRNYGLSRIDEEFSSDGTLTNQPMAPILSEVIESAAQTGTGI